MEQTKKTDTQIVKESLTQTPKGILRLSLATGLSGDQLRQILHRLSVVEKAVETKKGWKAAKVKKEAA